MVKFTFELVYAFYILSLNHIIHGDPHLNNMTYHDISRMREQSCGVSLYVIEGAYYFVPDILYHATLIDFGSVYTLDALLGQRDVFPFRKNIIDDYFHRLDSALRAVVTVPEGLDLHHWFETDPELLFMALATFDLVLFTGYLERWKALSDSASRYPRTIATYKALAADARAEIEYRLGLLVAEDIDRLRGLPSPYPRIIGDNFSHLREQKIDYKEYGLYKPEYHPCDPLIHRAFSPDFPRNIHFEDIKNYII